MLLESRAPPGEPLSPPTPLWVIQHLNFASLSAMPFLKHGFSIVQPFAGSLLLGH